MGLGWVNSGSAHGVAYNAAEGIMDLGTINAGASTRANAVSDDGSIVVGWQDLNGPWKAAVWHKDPNGGYQPNTYILIDPSGSATDEFNQAGSAVPSRRTAASSAVTATLPMATSRGSGARPVVS